MLPDICDLTSMFKCLPNLHHFIRRHVPRTFCLLLFVPVNFPTMLFHAPRDLCVHKPNEDSLIFIYIFLVMLQPHFLFWSMKGRPFLTRQQESIDRRNLLTEFRAKGHTAKAVARITTGDFKIICFNRRANFAAQNVVRFRVLAMSFCYACKRPPVCNLLYWKRMNVLDSVR